VTSPTAAIVQTYQYEGVGERRKLTGGHQDRTSPLYGFATSPTTDRGFTMHEHLDEMNLIHMNGRIYDPALARFMTPDSELPGAMNQQAYNRYSYVFNNPLAYTDPTGHWGFSIGPISFHTSTNVVRVAAAVAVAMYAPQFVSAFATPTSGLLTWMGSDAIGGYVLSIPGSIAAGAGGGFGAALIASGGNFDAGVRGALGGAAFGLAGTVGEPMDFTRYAAHAGAGCIQSSLGGGGCGSGAMSAVAGKFATNISGGSGIAAVVAGGTISAIGGGKFANGAVTAGFGYLFNQMVGRAAAAARGCLLCLGGRPSDSGYGTGSPELDDALGSGSKARALILNEANEATPPVPGATPGRETSGRTTQWEKPGGMPDANRDFDQLNPSNVRDLPNGGRVGTLPDGRTVVVRPTSTDGRPTVEIQDGKNRDKVRYGP